MAVSLHMGWRRALFANWPVEPAAVDRHLPDSLAVDTRDGRAWLSVVPYVNVDVRPTWLPAGTGIRLPELNLRTYVVRDGDPGVYFFSLDAEGIAGVLGARATHSLPYYYARIETEATGDRLRFESDRRHPGARSARFRATYGPTGDRLSPAPGSLAHFIAERYRFYAEPPDGGLWTATVDHEPWPLYQADAAIEENTLFAANGFAPPDGDPVCYYSPGVETVTSRGRRIAPAASARSP